MAPLTAANDGAQTAYIVKATLALNWTEQAPRYTYAVLEPNVIDRALYAAALSDLTATVRGLAGGQAVYGASAGVSSSCNGPLPALNECASRYRHWGASTF